MADQTNTIANADQIAFWNGPGGEQWAKGQESMDENLRPFAEAAIALAAPMDGESALDVGCGCGDTTLILSERLGLDGRAVGLDISGPMIARAKERAAAFETMGLPSPKFLIGDASTHKFRAPNYDLLFSRFGVMFFDNPTAAFANMRKGLRSGGRTAFICWQPMAKNDFFLVPTAAALTVLPAPEPPTPNAPGPFAFGDNDRLNKILADAGFDSIQIESHFADMEVGEADAIPDAAKTLTKSGPLTRLVADADEATTEKVLEAVESALANHISNGKIKLGTQTWLVSAKNP
jgi:SAM-dependent methyltransferase